MNTEERQQAEREVAEMTSPAGVERLLERLIEVGAPIAEDGGSDEQVGAFQEVYADLCATHLWLQRRPLGGADGK